MLKELFEKAKQHNIPKKAIGEKMYGKNWCALWMVKNPTERTLIRIETALNELIEERTKNEN